MKKRIKKVAVRSVAVLLILAILSYSSVMLYINHSVEKYIDIAVQVHPDSGDEVSALIEYVKCDSHSLRTRNLAVWTLGRIGDTRALETLEAAYISGECDHDRGLCQYELSKAIKLCKAE